MLLNTSAGILWVREESFIPWTLSFEDIEKGVYILSIFQANSNPQYFKSQTLRSLAKKAANTLVFG
jgi:hypothetical protein